jgi:hypothetical protein
VLDEHVRKCAACRERRDADDALRVLASEPLAGLVPDRAQLFDDSVIRDLRAAGADDELPKGWRGPVRACARSLSFEFCMQLAGGGLAAASITGFLVVSALNPAANERKLSPYELRAISAVERNEPPVPLESLFQSPSPRAAMLWAAPGRSPRPAAVEDRSPTTELRKDTGHKRTPRRHGSARSARYLG